MSSIASKGPELSKGFWRVIEVIKPQQRFVIIPTQILCEIAPNIPIYGL
ncbi:hypothetical protein [Flavobacterium sp.]